MHKPYDKDFIPNPDPDQTVEVPGDVTYNTFEGLTPSTEYEFQVSAHTQAGPGDFITKNFTTLPVKQEG